MTMCIERHMNM